MSDFKGVELTSFRYGKTKGDKKKGKSPVFYVALSGKHNDKDGTFFGYNKVAIILAQQIRLLLSDEIETPEPAAVGVGKHFQTSIEGVSLDLKDVVESEANAGNYRFEKFSHTGPTAGLEAALEAYKDALKLALTGIAPARDNDIELEIIPTEDPDRIPPEDLTAGEGEESSPACEEKSPEPSSAPSEEAVGAPQEASEETPEPNPLSDATVDTPEAENSQSEGKDGSSEKSPEEKSFGDEPDKADDFKEKSLDAEETPPAETTSAPDEPASQAARPSRGLSLRRGRQAPEASDASDASHDQDGQPEAQDGRQEAAAEREAEKAKAPEQKPAAGGRPSIRPRARLPKRSTGPSL